VRTANKRRPERLADGKPFSYLLSIRKSLSGRLSSGIGIVNFSLSAAAPQILLLLRAAVIILKEKKTDSYEREERERRTVCHSFIIRKIE